MTTQIYRHVLRVPMRRKTTRIYKPKLCLVGVGEIILLLAAGAVGGMLLWFAFVLLFTL